MEAIYGNPRKVWTIGSFRYIFVPWGPFNDNGTMWNVEMISEFYGKFEDHGEMVYSTSGKFTEEEERELAHTLAFLAGAEIS